MTLISFTKLSGGLNKDVNPELLPTDPMVWTEASNIRFINDSVYSTYGTTQAVVTPISPYYVFSTINGQKNQIVVCGQNQVYAYYSGTWSNITNIDFDYSNSNSNWQHCFINNYPVLNNATNRPQVWKSTDQDVKLTDLPGWDYLSTCQVIRSFKAYLLAGNLIESGVVYQNRIRWSSSALPNSLPQSWDEADVTNDAGYIDLSDTPGPIIDMRVLGDNLIIYKQRATYLCMYIAGNSIFSFKQVFNNIGAINKDCICDLNGQHFVVTADDVILTDGNSYKSIIDGTMRRFLFKNLNQNKYTKMFVVPNYKDNEIWVCIPNGTYPSVNKAFIFNYRTGAWSTRQITNLSHITNMSLDISNADTFANSSQTFNSSNFIYDLSNNTPNQFYLVGSNYVQSRLEYYTDVSTNDSGYALISTLERQNISLGDDENIKIVKRIWPKMRKLYGSDSTVNFYIGTQMKKNDAITWSSAMPFNITTGDKIDFFATGRWISIRIENTGDICWAIDTLEFEVESGGKW